MPFNPLLQLGAQTAAATARDNVYSTEDAAPQCMWTAPPPTTSWQPFLRQRVPPPRLLPFLARTEQVVRRPPPRMVIPTVLVFARSCP